MCYNIVGDSMQDNVIVLLFAFIGSLIGVMTPIIKLNSSITKLNITINNLNEQFDINKQVVETHTEKLNNHELRIDRLERK